MNIMAIHRLFLSGMMALAGFFSMAAAGSDNLTTLPDTPATGTEDKNANSQDVVPETSREIAPDRTFAQKVFARRNKRFLKKRLSYYFVAQNDKNCDIFYGLVQDNPFIGYASINFFFPNGCECHGHALVTHFPIFGGAAGQKGWIHARCSDGRSLKGRFTTTSLTSGTWDATDSLENHYEGSFGHTVQDAVVRVNELRQKLHCPACDPKDIELKVQGRILPGSK
jgi:hypothetical protein